MVRKQSFGPQSARARTLSARPLPIISIGSAPPAVSRSKTEASVDAFILPRLGDEEVLTLTAARLRKWVAEIAASPPAASHAAGTATERP